MLEALFDVKDLEAALAEFAAVVEALGPDSTNTQSASQD